MTTKPCLNSKEWVQVKRCEKCERFETDLEAAEWYYNKFKAVLLDEIIGIVVKVDDLVGGR
jgi:hypothetical protein